MSTNNVRFVDDESTQAHLSVLEAAKQADHSESDMNLIDVMFTGQLTALSGSKKFRRFFDIKQNHWEDFLNTVFATVLWYSTWGNVRDDDLLSDTIRSLCADAFLLNYGTTYWGDEEDRLEFLVEERVRHDDTCLYPQNYTALHLALTLLIKRCSIFKYEHRPGNFAQRVNPWITEGNFEDISEPVRYHHRTSGSYEYMDMFD